MPLTRVGGVDGSLELRKPAVSRRVSAVDLSKAQILKISPQHLFGCYVLFELFGIIEILMTLIQGNRSGSAIEGHILN